MWEKLNGLQRRIAIGTLVVALVMIFFPPLNIERSMGGFSDGRQNLALEFTEFHGWGFIGQIDTSPSRQQQFKDPNNPTLLERFEAASPTSLEDFRQGKKRLAFTTLLQQLLVLLAVAGVALYLTRSDQEETN